MRRRSDDWRFFARAEASATDLLEGVALSKAAPKILTRSGFDAVVRELIGKLSGVTRGPDAAALRKGAKRLNVRWDNLTAAQRERVIVAAAAGLRAIPKIIVPKVEEILKPNLARIVSATKAATASEHALVLVADLSAQDKRVVNFAASSQGSYITDQYGERATAYEKRARDIVAKGLEKGLGRDDIGEMLAEELTGPMLGRADSYWDVVASTHVARARAYGQIASYSDAGIEKYAISAALDEVCCILCRFLNGKEFTVESSLDRYNEVEDSDDPYAVTTMQPFLRVGSTDDGDRFLYVNGPGGKTHHVADVLEDATGERDDDGRYGREASEAKLQELGVSVPAHGRCRCLTVPV